MDIHQEQKDAYRGVIATVGDGHLAALDAYLAQDMIDHNPMPGQAPGITGFKQWASAVRSSFPDFRGSVETVLAEENLVAGRVLWRGTQQGSFLGLPPSGRQVEIAAFHIVRLSAGRIVEWWGTADLLGALGQLGSHRPAASLNCKSSASGRASPASFARTAARAGVRRRDTGWTARHPAVAAVTQVEAWKIIAAPAWRNASPNGAHRWPAPARVEVRFRGRFAYVDGHLPGGELQPLCRLRYGGSASIWRQAPDRDAGRGRAPGSSCRRRSSTWSTGCSSGWASRPVRPGLAEELGKVVNPAMLLEEDVPSPQPDPGT